MSKVKAKRHANLKARPPDLRSIEKTAGEEQDADSTFVTIDEVVARLAYESVRSRMRHRALLKTLREGEFNWDRYTLHLEEIEESDAQALFDLLVLKWEIFEPRYREWMQEDFEQYGFRRIREQPQPEGSASEPSTE